MYGIIHCLKSNLALVNFALEAASFHEARSFIYFYGSFIKFSYDKLKILRLKLTLQKTHALSQKILPFASPCQIRPQTESNVQSSIII